MFRFGAAGPDFQPSRSRESSARLPIGSRGRSIVSCNDARGGNHHAERCASPRNVGSGAAVRALGFYRAARALALGGKYEEAIAAFRALDHDDSAEVANYIGYANRKLGNYEAARIWYEKALAADPNHVRTWQYYGMWHVEQGNVLKAQDFLEKIRSICGGSACKEYADLKAAIEGNISY